MLNRLGDTEIEQLLRRAEELTGETLPLDGEARAALRAMADGDGRYALNLAEELLTGDRDEVLDTAATK